MESLLQGRLRNTHLPQTKGLFPLFEAVVNSIQGAEEQVSEYGGKLADHYIAVEVVRDAQEVMSINGGGRASKPIVEFEVHDNGIGFTDSNLVSFNTLDSLKKADKGCRGIGRLLWLKAFDRVEVSSVYEQDGEKKLRSFTFDASNDVEMIKDGVAADGGRSTSIKLIGFSDKYSKLAPKTLKTICLGLLEHCLWYFVRSSGVPKIVVRDGDEQQNLYDLYDEYMHSSASVTSVDIKGYKFDITHVKFRANSGRGHTANYCAAGRLVKEEAINGKIRGLTSSNLHDDLGCFSYSSYISSEYLDERVHSQRTGFDILEDVDGLFGETEVSFKDIWGAISSEIENYLDPCLRKNLDAGRKRINAFVSSQAPKYRPILRHLKDKDLIVDPSISDKDLDLLLHKCTYKIEQNIISEGHEISSPMEWESEDTYKERLDNYLNTVSDLKQSDLAAYVTHRRSILDLLDIAIRPDDNKKISFEHVLHNLVVPMGVTSEDEEYKRQNLWLIDERLAFHEYLASDKPISTNPTSSSISSREPDISILQTFENPLFVSDNHVNSHSSLTVVEIKRPLRNDYVADQDISKNPIDQAVDYLVELRKGAKHCCGRPISNASTLPGFVYVIADLTEKMVACCDRYQLKIGPCGDTYFGYHDNYNAYIQVISFDGLLRAAKERNRAFFDQLGLPSH